MRIPSFSLFNMPHLFLEKQNHPEQIRLLRASSAAYRKAKTGEITITYFIHFLSVAYPISYLFIKDDNVKYALFGCSFLISILIDIFLTSFKGDTSKGAVFKEEFDTTVFNLPWKSTLRKPDHSEVVHFSQQYEGAEIKDWYSPNLSASIEQNSAIAILQHSNTSWDIELRKIYSKWLIVFIVSYSVVICSLFIVLKIDGLTFFLLLYSLHLFFAHFISLIRGHSGVIEKRASISRHLDELIRSGRHITTRELRDIQDEIYLTRQEPTKVPDFFFRRYKDQLNSEAEEYIQEANRIFETK